MKKHPLALMLAAWLILAPAAHAKPQVLRLGLQDNPSTLDPALASNVPAIGVSHWLYNGLVTFDAQARIVPDLAERYVVSPDGKRYTFTLRRGVRFHDGKALTSADVRYSLNRLLLPETKSPGASFYRAIVGAPAALDGKAKSVAGIQAPDARTVVIALTEAQPTFLQVLGLNYAAIVPQGAGEREGFAKAPVGTGPFRLKEYTSGQRLVFERNPHYFKAGLPKLAAVEVQLGLNEQVEALRFERGDLDAIGLLRAIGAADFARLASNPEWRQRFLTKPDHATYYVGMNNRIKPFDDARVRRAVSMAIDKRRLVKLVNGRGVPALGFLPPTLPGANPQVQGNPYDPARAKALLAEAGYPHGFQTTYWCSNSQTAMKIAQSIQYDLSRIGIQATLRPLAFPMFLAAVGREGNVPIFTGNWSQDFPDPANFLGTIFSSRAIRSVNSLDTTFFSDATVDRLLDAAAGTMHEPTRFDLYRKVEHRVLALSPVAPLFHPKRFALAQPGVKGLELHPVWPVDAERIEVTR